MSELTYERISSHFHLPINEASKELSVCATILKKVCRSLGIKRWPHRKIRSLDNMIAQLTEQLEETSNIQEITRIKSEIENFEKTKDFIINNPNTSYKSVVPKSTLQSFSKSKTKNNSNSNNSNNNRFVVTPNSEELVLEVLTNLANQKENFNNNNTNHTMINTTNDVNTTHVNNTLVSSIPTSPELVNFSFSPNSPPKPPLKKLILQRRKQEEELFSHTPLFNVDNLNHSLITTTSTTVNNDDSNHSLNHLLPRDQLIDHQITPHEKENSANNNIQIISFTSHSQPSKKRKIDEFDYDVPSLDEFRKYKSTFPNIKYQRIFEDSLVYISKSS